MLNAGMKAPEFCLPDQNGTMVDSKTLAGCPYVIYFYPKDSTSGCTKQAQAYSQRLSEFEAAGYRVFGVSKDSVASHKRFEEKYELTITLLSDVEKAAITAFDVWQEKKNYGKVSMGVVRTSYVVGADGTILFANPNTKAADDCQKVMEQLGL
ncbi:MAG: peroxiredoxin [Oscillospiraceae bacterium]|nr:peroxiredoxin [Oscillospiraceae bacterium]